MGQICTATSRVFVHERIHDEFLRRFVAYTDRVSVVGDPFAPETWHGPQVSRAQHDKILAYVQSARDDGAVVVAGGRTAPGRPDGKGFYIEPTIVSGVDASMRVYREEVFGPLVTVTPFHAEDEVLRLANDTEYGLGSAVFTNDITRAVRVAGELQAGMVWINSSNDSDLRVPFGGVKQSGIGRELGQAGLEAYSVLKAVHLNLVFASPDI